MVKRVQYVGPLATFAGACGELLGYNGDGSVRVLWDIGEEATHSAEAVLITAGEEEVPSCADPVNQPQHYASGEIECIDAIRASMTKEAFCGYLKGCAQKYFWRYEKKINPVEDIKKARWYSERLIKELEDA